MKRVTFGRPEYLSMTRSTCSRTTWKFIEFKSFCEQVSSCSKVSSRSPAEQSSGTVWPQKRWKVALKHQIMSPLESLGPEWFCIESMSSSSRGYGTEEAERPKW
jgi:hypothetical protein